MRIIEPPLPSISFVLAQASGSRPRPKRPSAPTPVRRSRSSPSFAPRPPRYPPQLERDYLLTTVDYRFIDPPRRPASRSSVALSSKLFEDDEAYEIVVEPPSPTDSLASSSSSSTTPTATSTSTSTSSSTSRRTLSAYLHEKLDAVRYKCQRVRRVEARLSFDLCT